ncbi:MAG: hypothetical protein HZC37_06720 [Burkholderiales bacterium]|nr:hypothetical protein [Burkholderiales bacterium]
MKTTVSQSMVSSIVALALSATTLASGDANIGTGCAEARPIQPAATNAAAVKQRHHARERALRFCVFDISCDPFFISDGSCVPNGARDGVFALFAASAFEAPREREILVTIGRWPVKPR